MCAKGGTLTVSSPGQGVSIHDGAAGAGALGALTGQLIDAASKNNPDDEDEKPKQESDPSNKEKEKKQEENKSNNKETQKVLDQSKKGIDNSKKHLQGGEKGDLKAAWRESKGEVVCRKKSGEPFDHINEVRETQQCLKKVIKNLEKKVLNNPKASASQAKEGEKLLSEASKLLDHSEGYIKSVPFNRMKGL